MEEWKTIVEIPDYEVSNAGNIRDKKTLNLIRQYKNSNGYKYIRIHKNGKQINTYVHRLVATAFLGSPMFDGEVNHKNGIRDDNNINNLEWVTHNENIRHSRFDLADKNKINKSKIRLNLKLFRIKNRLTQEEIANMVGITRTAYAFIENGDSDGRFDFWLTLQNKLNIPNEEMFSLMKIED